MKVLILGGGYTGLRLGRWLAGQGISVCLTNRQGKPLRELALPVFPFAYTPMGDARPLPIEALAGVTHVLSTIPPDAQGVDPVAVSLLDRLQGQKLTWFGYLSTTGIYGDTQGAWVDETAPYNPQNARSQHRVTAETQFLQSSLPTHIFRLPGIYGPGRSIFDRLQAGAVQHVVKPGHVFSRVHVDDIVQTLGRSIQNPQPGTIYNVADDEPTESSVLLIEACRLLGIDPPPPLSFDPEQMSPMAASFWQECRRVSNHKIKTELGVNLCYPTYREGLKAILNGLCFCA
ncbi:SDR family NAD(P)-dependent oxidoreductase [Synechococcales cyanobacterium C]|uniref:SDR family NAD(P)-dependent oxidoreductase n=1 Tax=Petrachloros mirabilis ULC683 TaxID=2781853 RepID=A0A8K2A969_9CYAN|nr:SDR family oxidoreductase [Petrachloros mirabilis]NCJ07840.1 SDR family NAD(P)-dependent oxidoreductase [Petrachloros mirabilis ULC683]